MDVSIIIVNYNTKTLLKNCLESIFNKTKNISFEVIVSDNGSRDGSIEMLKIYFPQVILIENSSNLGFGAANNKALSIANGKYIFYLNSDTLLLNNAIKYFFDFFELNEKRYNLGAIGCQLLNSNNQFVHYGGNLPCFKKELLQLIRTSYGLFKQAILNLLFHKPIPAFKMLPIKKYIGQIGYITGAALFLKNDYFAKFDEDFFMYNEDTYLQYILNKNGKSRMIIEGPQIIHLEGKSSNTITVDIIHRETSFSHIQQKITNIIYYKKTGISNYKLYIMKFFIILLWLNPYIFPKARKSIITLIKT